LLNIILFLKILYKLDIDMPTHLSSKEHDALITNVTHTIL